MIADDLATQRNIIISAPERLIHLVEIFTLLMSLTEQTQLEQLERLRSEIPPPPHDYPY